VGASADVPPEGQPRPNSLDPIADLWWAVSFLRDLDWFSAGAEAATLLGSATARTAESLWYVWDVLRDLATAVSSGWQQLVTGLFRLWDLWIHPELVRLHNISLALFNGAELGLSVGLAGLRYLVSSWADPLIVWLQGQWDTLRYLVSYLSQLRNVFLVVSGAVDSLGSELETRAFGAFEAARAKLNEAVAWLNHLCHPTGVVREDPYVWSSIVYHGDLLAVLINGLVPDGLDAIVAALRAVWPVRPPSHASERFVSPTSASDPAMAGALDRARRGG